MIRKLKIKFILLSMTTLVILLTVILAGMSLLNYNSVIETADKTLSYLSQNKGTFPEIGGQLNNILPPHMSSETPYESRYFSVLLDSSGAVIGTDMRKISSIDHDDAISYAQNVLKTDTTVGFADDFRYIITTEPAGTRVIFLDCGRSLDAFHSFLRTSLFMAIIGLIAVFFVIFIVSGKIIKPIAESYAKQKQFITNAGHEIKTPLTIINANVDILEMELGEDNESLSDIKGQTLRLRSLTDELVMLTRMEEAENNLPKIDFPISEVVTDAVRPFYALAQIRKKTLTCHITPFLTLNGNDKAINKLVSLLLDNALKYSASDSEIELSLTKQGHSILLSVSNMTEYELNQSNLDRVFDRFYRDDSSRNSETGGHGIGLAVAKAIVTAHGGKISATVPKPHMFQMSASFPI